MQKPAKIILTCFLLGVGIPSIAFSQVRIQTINATTPASVTPLTVKDLFRFSLKNSERIAMSEQTIREAEGLYRQALGSSFPLLSFRYTTLWNERGDRNENAMFRVSQTGLTGYRELFAVRSGRFTINQRKFEYQRVEQLLLADLAAAFYGLLQSKENVAATQRLLEYAGQRLEELDEREKVGRIRSADTVGQNYQMVLLNSQLEESQRQVSARTDLLAFLAGIPSIEVVGEIASLPKEPLAMDFYLGRMDSRPDVQAIEENVKANRGLVHMARADFFPQVDVAANKYTNHLDDDNSEWDVGLSINMPIWDWGERKGALDASGAVLNQTEESLNAARRQAQLEIRNAYRDYLSARKQFQLLQQAVDLARQDYELQVKDDAQGLVTSLEVLTSLDRLNAAELDLSNARLQERLAAINLKIAAGFSPEEIFL